MDPFEQRLTDAGAAWRQSQPEAPDINRLVASLDRRPSRAFSPRFAFVLVAGLVLIGSVAAAPGVGNILNAFRNRPVATGSSSPAPAPGVCVGADACASPVAATPVPTAAPTVQPTAQPTTRPTPELKGAARATALVDAYEAALVARQWQTAFDILAPTSPTSKTGLPAYAAERAPYYASVAGRYTIGAPTQDVADWTTYGPLIEGADTAQAYLVEVDYPALAGNNAGYEQFVVAPDASGTWRIWPVR
jgi:hypothetical protein